MDKKNNHSPLREIFRLLTTYSFAQVLLLAGLCLPPIAFSADNLKDERLTEAPDNTAQNTTSSSETTPTEPELEFEFNPIIQPEPESTPLTTLDSTPNAATEPEPEPNPLFSFSDDIDWSGYLKNETAFRYREPRTITKIRNSLSLDAGYTFNSRYSMNFSGLFYYDMAYDLFDYDTIAARREREAIQPLAFIFNLDKEKDSLGADIRELYLDIIWSDVDLRIGRQFVVWGVLEGVRIVDEINPIDFRELILPDLLDYRIPLWMAKLDYYRDEGTYQFLWIPDIRFHKAAPPGSEWELLQEVPGTEYPDSSDSSNWEYGFRLSTTIWDTDVTFSYFYTWDDFQVVFRDVLINQSNVDPNFLARYARISMYGTTINKQVGEYILKGELAFVTNKYFAIEDVDQDGDGFLDFLGELQRDHLRWGLGLEFSWKGTEIASSIVQWFIYDYEDYFIQSEYDTSVNVFIRKPMPQSSMLFEFLAIDFITLQEVYYNPELTYFVSDRFQFSIGLDIFSGDSSQFGVLSNTSGSPDLLNQRSRFIGNFHNNDRAYAEFKYSF